MAKCSNQQMSAGLFAQEDSTKNASHSTGRDTKKAEIGNLTVSVLVVRQQNRLHVDRLTAYKTA